MNFCSAAGGGCVIALLLSASAFSQVNVSTYHNDNFRTGANLQETILTPADVNTNTFGLLFSQAVDGYVYAEPLYLSGLNIPGKGVHNVVFVATGHNSVYAFDADSPGGPTSGLLWHINLGPAASTPSFDFALRWGPYFDVSPEVGILGTPVIDPASGTLYLDSLTYDGANYTHRMHALSVTNGAERPFSPVVVTASVPGVGVDAVNGVVTFHSIQQIQRPALTLAGGVVYVAYAGYGDTDPYHGWIIGFDAHTLAQKTNYVFNTTPNSALPVDGNAGEGGIWMSGNGLAVDDGTNLYVVVANGVFNANLPGGTEYGDSVIKFSTTNGLAVADWFTPADETVLAENDLDLGSGGPLLLPDSVGSAGHPHLMITSGKEGTFYVMDRHHLGNYSPPSDSQILQEMPAANDGMWSSMAYFNGMIYHQGKGDPIVALPVDDGVVGSQPLSTSTTPFAYPPATPVISANGTTNAIVWALENHAYSAFQGSGPAILHAYDAYNLANELYNSSQAGSRDQPGPAVKFTIPTVANGKVFIGGQYSLSVYGLGTFLDAPVITPAARLFTNSVTVTISDTAPNATIFYTLDGSTPGTNSLRYTGSLLLTNSATIQALAFKSGAVPSRVTTAYYEGVNSAYERAVLGCQPIAYWRFNESTGPTAFDCMGNYDAAYGVATTAGVAGPAIPAFPGFGPTNLAAQIGGSQSWVTVPPLNDTAVTITAWIYPFGIQNYYTGLFCSRDPGGGNTLNFAGNNQLGYGWNGYDSPSLNFESGLIVPPDQWSFVALVIEPSQATLYVGNSNVLNSAISAVPNDIEEFQDTSRIGDDYGWVGR